MSINEKLMLRSRQDCEFLRTYSRFPSQFHSNFSLIWPNQTFISSKETLGEIWNTCAVQTRSFDGNKLFLLLLLRRRLGIVTFFIWSCLLPVITDCRDEIVWSYSPSSFGRQSSSSCQVSWSHEKLTPISHRKAWSRSIFVFFFLLDFWFTSSCARRDFDSQLAHDTILLFSNISSCYRIASTYAVNSFAVSRVIELRSERK